MITVPEAAKRTHRNPETIRRWIREGRLRAEKVGTQHLIDEDDLGNVLDAEPQELPAGWRRTATGEAMPDIVHALERSRARR